jgi:Xaa-Pro aminopeptidase
MSSDPLRLQRIADALKVAQLDALVCALPANVLLLSGYWPVVGTSIAIVTRTGQAAILVPQDEVELTDQSWAKVYPFSPGSLTRLSSAVEAAVEPLGTMLHDLGLTKAKIGHESGSAFEPSSYASMHLYQNALPQLLGHVAPRCAPQPADRLLAELKAVKTPHEIQRIRQACLIALQAFRIGAHSFQVGLSEAEAAAFFRVPLSAFALKEPSVRRADGFIFCMSGPNSAQAYGAYARSRNRHLAEGDLALVHCNSYVDGHWTDITRTYCLGRIDERNQAMYDAVFEARAAALAAIRPGVRARDIDAAARRVLADKGFADAFKHGTGHGVGFAAINHTALPRIHPASDDVLAEGMVFNVEPAIYIDGYGGMRHCDMALVTPDGHELLTPFQERPMEVG